MGPLFLRLGRTRIPAREETVAQAFGDPRAEEQAVSDLVLSLFPGIGLLDMAFEAEGFCVVRGPDLLWGGDVRTFHPPSGRFDGVIGGPPCQRWSRLANIVRAVHGEASLAPDLIPEFRRVVQEAEPTWFLMENVPGAPAPETGYQEESLLANNRWTGADQNRERRFTFGTREGRRLHPEWAALLSPRWEPAVTSSAGGRRASIAIGGSGKPKGNQGRSPEARLKNRTFAEECALQGLPADFLADAPFTASAKRVVVGNGVPLPMGRAIARAVKAALSQRERSA
jgi:DNA (cytosine-5)-methyltransferase 1